MADEQNKPVKVELVESDHALDGSYKLTEIHTMPDGTKVVARQGRFHPLKS